MDTIRRRRCCDRCEKRFTTYERVEGIDLNVIKKDGTREVFCREKLKKGILKATWKRPVTLEQIDSLVTEVEQKLRLKNSTEVKSWEIGKLVINRLRKIDPLSYLLFASVYRDFQTLNDFEKELKTLMEARD
jgi:transcriptional repressor NrdR